LEKKVILWAAWAAIIAIPVAIISILIAHSDATKSSTDEATGPASPRSSGSTINPSLDSPNPDSPSPEPTETIESHPALWEGKLRITSDGVNLGGGSPHVGDGAFATILYYPDEHRYSTNNSNPAAPWLAKDNPSYDDCVAQLGTNAFSYQEYHNIRYQKNLGICVRAFDGGNIVFIRLTAALSGEGALAYAIIWPPESE
jgi:hypothetical protein